MDNHNTSSIVLRGEGVDVFWNVLKDYGLRSIRVEDQDYYSLVDLMEVFGLDNSKSKSRKSAFNPRRYWSDHKKSLLDDDGELYDSIVQLKAKARDGKMYNTDFAPRWVCLYITMGMHTPSANAFRKRIAKVFDQMSKIAIKYRALNVDQGMEWRADTNHAEMRELEPPDDLSAHEDRGYSVKKRK